MTFLQDANNSERNKYLGDGNHLLNLLEVFTKDTRNSGESLIVSFVVEDTSSPTHSVGEKRSVSFRIGLQDAVKRQMEQTKALNFFREVSGIDDADKAREWAVKAMQNPGSATGIRVKAFGNVAVKDGKPIVTKKGTVIVNFDWGHVPESEQGDLKTRRGALVAEHLAKPEPKTEGSLLGGV